MGLHGKIIGSLRFTSVMTPDIPIATNYFATQIMWCTRSCSNIKKSSSVNRFLGKIGVLMTNPLPSLSEPDPEAEAPLQCPIRCC